MAEGLQPPPGRGGRNAPSLLVFADDWGRHPSSCQHLIRRLREDYPVLWVNTIGTRQVRADSLTLRRGLEKLRRWTQGLQQVSERMWVIDLPMLPGLGNRFLRGINRLVVTAYLKYTLARLGMRRLVVLTTLPYIGWLIRDVQRQALVYYCTDDYSHWPSADRATLVEADREMSGRADLILAASRALFASHAYTARCRYFPHGVDFAHFAAVQGAAVAKAVAQLPRPRIGFFGLIYEKIDFALLTALAQRLAPASLVLIGPVAYCPPEFAALPNVYLLGPSPYEELPGNVAGLDVLLLPYVNDEMIRQSGPLKLRECLASGKPTVSIDIPEVRPLQPHVRIGASQGEFLEQVRRALDEPRDPIRIRARQASVQGEGWDRRAEELRSYLAGFLPAQRDGQPSPAGQRPPRRVLHLRTISGKGGGPEKTLLNSPRFLCDAYALRLAYIRPVGDKAYDMPERARRLGVDLVDIPERGAVDVRTLWRLAREVAGFRPHLLHAHDYKTNVLSVLLGRWFGVPVVTTLHGYVSHSPRLDAYYTVDRWALRHMAHVVAVSADLYRWVADLGIPSARRSLIENGIDTTEFARRLDVEDAKRKQGVPPGRLVVGAVGRLAAEKGFHVLIRAFHRLLPGEVDAELWIIGEGDEAPRLQALIADLGVGERVRLLGYRSDTRELYEALDVFALSSYREGLPNVLLEAMALQVPVVATHVAGIPDVIRNGENGLLVEPGDEAEMARGIGQLLGNPGLRSRLGSAGRTTIEAGYSFAARMQKVRKLYDDLLQARPADGRPRVQRLSEKTSPGRGR